MVLNGLSHLPLYVCPHWSLWHEDRPAACGADRKGDPAQGPYAWDGATSLPSASGSKLSNCSTVFSLGKLSCDVKGFLSICESGSEAEGKVLSCKVPKPKRITQSNDHPEQAWPCQP